MRTTEVELGQFLERLQRHEERLAARATKKRFQAPRRLPAPADTAAAAGVVPGQQLPRSRHGRRPRSQARGQRDEAPVEDGGLVGVELDYDGWGRTVRGPERSAVEQQREMARLTMRVRPVERPSRLDDRVRVRSGRGGCG